MFASFLNIRLVALACSFILLIAPVSLEAAVLSGSGPNLPIPTVNPPWPPCVALTRTTVTGGFTGTWASPADANWIGTFSATGPIPNNTSLGTTRYDFSALPNGNLPAGTFFIFSDVDSGTFETFDLIAFNSGGSPLSLWLDDTWGVTGTGTGTAGAIVAGNMPGWDWSVTTTNTYRIDGSSVTGGNPSVGFALVSNQPIVTMTLVKRHINNSFSLRAPEVPEPGSAVLALLGMSAWAFTSRRKRTVSNVTN